MIYANLSWPLTNYSSINVVPYGLGLRELYWEGFRTSFATLGPPLVAVIISSALSLPFLVVLALPIVLGMFCLRYGRAAFDRFTLPYWIAGSAFWRYLKYTAKMWPT